MFMKEDLEFIIKNKKQIETLEREGDFSNKFYSLKDETNFLIQSTICEIANSQPSPFFRIKNLYDYSIPFELLSTFNGEIIRVNNGNSFTDFKKILVLFLSSKKTTIEHKKNIVFSIKDFFNSDDARIENYKKPSYIIQTELAIKELKKLCLFDKKNNSTSLNHFLKEEFSKKIEECDYDSSQFEINYEIIIDCLISICKSESNSLLNEIDFEVFVMKNQALIKKLREELTFRNLL